MKLLEGQIEDDDRDEQIADLQRELRETRAELLRAKADATQAKQETARAVSALRRQLTPLYRALQAVFGELDAAGVEDMPSPTSPSRTADPRWESWKQKMSGRPAEIIDLLLLHGEMNRNQLMAAMHVGKDVVRVTLSRLNVAGLLNKNGGRFSLKQL